MIAGKLITSFLIILLVTSALLVVTYALDKNDVSSGLFEKGLFDWFMPDDAVTAQNVLGSVAEVVCGVLAIVITVVAIIVQLAANRYTSKIIELFINDRINLAVLSLFIITCVHGMWIANAIEVASSSTGNETLLPRIGITVFMCLTSLSFFILVPYFYYVFKFLKPQSIIMRIKKQALGFLGKAKDHGGNKQKESDRYHGLQDNLVENIEQLSEMAMSSLSYSDSSLGLHCVRSLKEIITGPEPEKSVRECAGAYLGEKSIYSYQWFAVQNKHFLELIEENINDIRLKQYWVEIKILHEYTSLLTSALNKDKRMVNAIAIRTREIAACGLDLDLVNIPNLAIRAFNTYLKHSIARRDALSTIDILYNYRLLAEEILNHKDRINLLLDVVKNFFGYGRTAYMNGMVDVLETIAYDLRSLNETAFRSFKKKSDSGMNENIIHSILATLLKIDDFPERNKDEETLLGIRVSHALLASYYLLWENDEQGGVLLERISDDMSVEPRERIDRIMKVIEDCTSNVPLVIDENRPNKEYISNRRKDKLRKFIEPLRNKP
jgi:hypothetical protein